MGGRGMEAREAAAEAAEARTQAAVAKRQVQERKLKNQQILAKATSKGPTVDEALDWS